MGHHHSVIVHGIQASTSSHLQVETSEAENAWIMVTHGQHLAQEIWELTLRHKPSGTLAFS